MTTLTDFITMMDRYPLLTAEQERDLARRVQEGDDNARDLFISSNLRLVVKIARRYQHQNIQLMDLIQEGAIGLQRAVELFDPKMGNRFSTYAVPWITQAVDRARMRGQRSVRLPYNVVQDMRARTRAVNELAQLLGREPSVSEIAEHLGVSEEQVQEDQLLARSINSLDAPTGAEGEMLIMIEDETAPVESDIVREQDAVAVREALFVLNEREQMIIDLRYGLDGGEPISLEAIGQRLGVTRERVRQLEAVALRKMRDTGLVSR